MKPVLLTDFGSTYTKLTAVDLDAAKLLGTAQAYTTVASDVRIGFQKALDALLAQMDALGRVSAGYVWAYPPGIPLLVPGERIEKSFLSLLNTLQASGVSLRGISDGLWVKC